MSKFRVNSQAVSLFCPRSTVNISLREELLDFIEIFHWWFKVLTGSHLKKCSKKSKFHEAHRMSFRQSRSVWGLIALTSAWPPQGFGGLGSIFIWDDSRELRNMGCSCLKIPCLSLPITWTTGMGHCTHLLCKCCWPKARLHACLPSTPSHLSAPSLIPNHISYHERTWYGGNNWRHQLCSKQAYTQTLLYKERSGVGEIAQQLSTPCSCREARFDS